MIEDFEIWKPVKDYEHRYEVSNLGRIRRTSIKVKVKKYKTTYIKLDVDNGSYDTYGYRRTVVSRNGKGKGVKLHQLVARAFIPNPENKYCVNHINGVRDDNRVENLEWCTIGENNTKAHETGIKDLRGHRNGRAKLTPEQVINIYKSKDTNVSLAQQYGVNKQMICIIKTGKSWKNVTSELH